MPTGACAATGQMIMREILKDLFFIERGYLNANHFVYRSKSPILIDTGYLSGFEETKRLITQLGVNLTDVSLIINTHTHCDHIGGNHIIQQASGCGIALHKIGKFFIDTEDNWSTWWRYFNQDAQFFKCTRALEDGDSLLLGPHEFQIIYTPGHASDGIVLYNRKNKILISSDTLWENDMPAMTLRIEGSAALFRMLESLEKLEALDVDIVIPGHGKAFTAFREALYKCKKRIEKYMLDRSRVGQDLIKKLIVYTLLMKKTISEKELYGYLMNTVWYRETVDLYFSSEYERMYNEIMDILFARKVVERNGGRLFTTVKP
jgi:hydroxyacylglutathione hydrolase